MSKRDVIVAILFLLTIGAPGMVDLGNATLTHAIMQMLICTALIVLITRFKEVLLLGYHLLYRLSRPLPSLPRNVRPVRCTKGRT